MPVKPAASGEGRVSYRARLHTAGLPAAIFVAYGAIGVVVYLTYGLRPSRTGNSAP